jgi:hypothetical protein
MTSILPMPSGVTIEPNHFNDSMTLWIKGMELLQKAREREASKQALKYLPRKAKKKLKKELYDKV